MTVAMPYPWRAPPESAPSTSRSRVPCTSGSFEDIVAVPPTPLRRYGERKVSNEKWKNLVREPMDGPAPPGRAAVPRPPRGAASLRGREAVARRRHLRGPDARGLPRALSALVRARRVQPLPRSWRRLPRGAAAARHHRHRARARRDRQRPRSPRQRRPVELLVRRRDGTRGLLRRGSGEPLGGRGAVAARD